MEGVKRQRQYDAEFKKEVLKMTMGGKPIVEVARDLEYHRNVSTAERIKREEEIRAETKRKKIRTTDSRHGYSIVPNILNRNFKTSEPNPKWVSGVSGFWAVRPEYFRLWTC